MEIVMKNTEDLRIAKTRQKLKGALLHLMETRSLNDITVSLLCREAHINRNTFYAHYSIPSDVLDEIFAEHDQTVVDQIRNTVSCSDYTLLLKDICRTMYEDREFTTLICKSNIGLQYLYHVMEIANQTILHIFRDQGIHRSSDLEFINRFATGGTLLIIFDWCMNGMKADPDLLAERLNKIDTYVLERW